MPTIGKPKVFYGYIVTAAGFTIQALAFGTLNTFGVFFTPMLDEFGWSRATLSLASISVRPLLREHPEITLKMLEKLCARLRAADARLG